MWPEADSDFGCPDGVAEKAGAQALAGRGRFATFGVEKTAEGMQAIRWFEKAVLEIAQYCCYDVKITRMIHEYGGGTATLLHGSIWKEAGPFL